MNDQLNRHNEIEGGSMTQVDILEHNEFRNLLHLRMLFKQATADESSQWLAKKLLMQRKLNIDLQ
jgi:hypothetical protein